ncbi:hypothetical protein BD770DRAFT_389496 [Pilaira anomala]|nr:hypothetical protein BD770DRAFT_389496 [Pilaira anomala]
MLKGITREDLYAQISNCTLDTLCDAKYQFHYTHASLALYNKLFNKKRSSGSYKIR